MSIILPCKSHLCRIVSPTSPAFWKVTQKKKKQNKNSDNSGCGYFRETGPQTFVQHGISRLVPGQRFFGQVLVGLCQAFHLSEASVQSHGRVTGVLGHVQVSCPPQLLLDHQRLLQQLQRDRQTEGGRETVSDRHRETKLRGSLFLFATRHNKSFNPLVDSVKKTK